MKYLKYVLGIIFYVTTASAQLVSSTPAQKFNQQMTVMSTQMFNQLNSGATRLYNLVWKNPDQVNLSPCQAFAALGINGVAARQSLAGVSAFLNAIVSGSFTLTEPSSYTLTNNNDGSVTCVAPTPTPGP